MLLFQVELYCSNKLIKILPLVFIEIPFTKTRYFFLLVKVFPNFSDKPRTQMCIQKQSSQTILAAVFFHGIPVHSDYISDNCLNNNHMLFIACLVSILVFMK